MDAYSFGYPGQCTKCEFPSNGSLKLPKPHYNEGESNEKVMLIGQDPYIHRQPNRVEYVLMLNQPDSQLSRWLLHIFGEDLFNKITLYATNAVKCPVTREPSTSLSTVLRLLKPYFNNCKDYLIDEIAKFRPTLVLTLGEPTHKLFVTILDNGKEFGSSMQDAFTGSFEEKAQLGDLEFDYSPCLHIRTFRIAETYGDKVKEFKKSLTSYFK